MRSVTLLLLKRLATKPASCGSSALFNEEVNWWKTLGFSIDSAATACWMKTVDSCLCWTQLLWLWSMSLFFEESSRFSGQIYDTYRPLSLGIYGLNGEYEYRICSQLLPLSVLSAAGAVINGPVHHFMVRRNFSRDVKMLRKNTV